MRTRILKDESGQVLAITILSMFLLMGCIALAIDVSLLFRAKRNVQIAADAAAIAAALQYDYNGSGTGVTTAADNAALANGITNANQVTVIPSPIDGYHTGLGYVEVRIVQPNPTFFINVFNAYYTGNNDSSVGVGARAVAGLVESPVCGYVLQTGNVANTFVAKGNTTITSPKCGWAVNSSSTSGFCDSGNAAVDAPYISIVGSQGTKGCGKPSGAAIYTGAAPVSDPYDNLLGPDYTKTANCNPAAGGNVFSGATLSNASNLPKPISPANGDIPIYCFSATNVLLSSVTLPTGIYVFENGVSMSGTVYAGCSGSPCASNGGATLDIAQGTFNQGNATLNLYAPTTGAYNSIGIMQPSTNTTGKCQDSSIKNKINTTTCLQLQFGSGGSATPPDGSINGMIYAPTATVYMQDQGGSDQITGIVADDVYVNSQLTLTDNYSDAHPNTSPLSHVALVE